MFVTHLIYKPGTRPSQVFPYCSIDIYTEGKSDGQCGNIHAASNLGNVSCAYCQWEFTKELQHITQNTLQWVLPVHYSIHPVFSRDGKGTLLHWEARCGVVNIYPEICLATRDKSEVTCEGCLNSFSN